MPFHIIHLPALRLFIYVSGTAFSITPLAFLRWAKASARTGKRSDWSRKSGSMTGNKQMLLRSSQSVMHVVNTPTGKKTKTRMARSKTFYLPPTLS